MTTETPCRYPECECDVTGGRCPNTRPAETPKCTHCDVCAECAPQDLICCACGRKKPAEPSACIICGNILTEGGEPYCWDHQPEPQGSEGSEPPTGTLLAGEMLVEKQRVIYALMAERDALKAERDALKASVAKRDGIDAGNLADYNALLAENDEPPMGRIEASERAMHANDRRMLDAYRAENVALKARVEELGSQLDDVFVECARAQEACEGIPREYVNEGLAIRARRVEE